MAARQRKTARNTLPAMSHDVNSANNNLFPCQGFPHTCVITKIWNNIIKFEILVFAYPFDVISLSDSQLFLLGKTWSRLLHLIFFFSNCWSHLELVWIHKYLLFYINSQVLGIFKGHMLHIIVIYESSHNGLDMNPQELGIRHIQRAHASYHHHTWVI